MSLVSDSKAVTALTYWKYSSLMNKGMKDDFYRPEAMLYCLAVHRGNELVGQMAKQRLEQPVLQEAQILPMKRRA